MQDSSYQRFNKQANSKLCQTKENLFQENEACQCKFPKKIQTIHGIGNN